MIDQPSKFTAKEVEYMAAALQSLEGEIPTYSKFEKAKFAALTGLSESSAQSIWSRIRKKLADGQGRDGATPVAIKGRVGNKSTVYIKRDFRALDEDGVNGGMAASTSHPNKKTKRGEVAKARDDEDAGAEAVAED